MSINTSKTKITISKREWLATDDDGDQLFCTHPRGPCKAMAKAGYMPEHFCPGCACLEYECK